MPTGTYALEVKVADLERRLARMESEQHGRTVRGWAAAARVLRVSIPTLRRWFKTDPKFPAPARIRSFKGNHQRRVQPEWSLNSLTQYNHNHAA